MSDFIDDGEDVKPSSSYVKKTLRDISAKGNVSKSCFPLPDDEDSTDTDTESESESGKVESVLRDRPHLLYEREWIRW